MADPERPAEKRAFETDTVQADRAREQGLGLGERELQAQRDPGGVRTADVAIGEEEGDEDQALDRSVAVQGRSEDSGPSQG